MKSHTLLLALLLAAFGAAACEAPPAFTGTHSKSKSKSHATSDDDDDDAAAADSSAVEATDPTPADLPEKKTPAPPVNPFGGATAFADTAPATDSSEHHLKTSNAGKDCMSCHAEGAGAPTFAFAGTLYRSKTGGDPATGVEVRVVDAHGAEIALVGTDSAGNFWFPSQTALPAGAHVGVRDGSTSKTMTGAIGEGGCNQGGCHATDRRMFLE